MRPKKLFSVLQPEQSGRSPSTVRVSTIIFKTFSWNFVDTLVYSSNEYFAAGGKGDKPPSKALRFVFLKITRSQKRDEWRRNQDVLLPWILTRRGIACFFIWNTRLHAYSVELEKPINCSTFKGVLVGRISSQIQSGYAGRIDDICYWSHSVLANGNYFDWTKASRSAESILKYICLWYWRFCPVARW